jgi:hypothetical protein
LIEEIGDVLKVGINLQNPNDVEGRHRNPGHSSEACAFGADPATRD